MFENLLVEQNPHWSGHLYPAGIQRECMEEVLRYLPLPHVVSITGIRRAGKSTLLKQVINYLCDKENINPHSILFVNLEHPYFSRYTEDVTYLEKMFEEYLKIAQPKELIYCLLDEIQFFRQWPVFVKAHYEQKRVKFLITGSNSFLMSKDLLTLLSGRTVPLQVFPLSFREMLSIKNVDPTTPLSLIQNRHEIQAVLESFLRWGGFPEVALLEKKDVADDILNAYAKTILYQDVASRLHLKKPLDLEKLYYYLSSHIGSCFSYSKLSQLFHLTDKTLKEYVKALVDAHLLFEIEKFSFSLQQQTRAPKKVYAMDPGLVNAIGFKFSENRGKLFENVIYLALRRSKKEVYYYKTKEDYEVDFLCKNKEGMELIQVCVDLNEDTEPRELRSLVRAARELELSHGTLITTDIQQEWDREGIKIRAIPLYEYISKS